MKKLETSYQLTLSRQEEVLSKASWKSQEDEFKRRDLLKALPILLALRAGLRKKE